MTSVPTRDTRHRPVRCIVKLGGAAVTQKEQFETLNEEVLSITAKQLRCAAMVVSSSSSGKSSSMDWSQESLHPKEEFPADSGLEVDTEAFVLVHGAGSFGHFQASTAKVNKGSLVATTAEFLQAGFVATRISVTKLNHEVVRALAAEGIPAVGVSPFSAGWSTIHQNLEHGTSPNVQRIVDAGFLPVLHGDAVLDRGQFCAILSGDVIVRELAQQLNPSYTVFLTNVPGVFDRPPSDPNATLLKEIAVMEDGSWRIVDTCESTMGVETSVTEHDTTGGMATKIAEAASIAASGIPVLIVEAGSIHALQALKGIPLENGDALWVGTIIRKQGEKSN